MIQYLDDVMKLCTILSCLRLTSSLCIISKLFSVFLLICHLPPSNHSRCFRSSHEQHTETRREHLRHVCKGQETPILDSISNCTSCHRRTPSSKIDVPTFDGEYVLYGRTSGGEGLQRVLAVVAIWQDQG